MKNKIFIVVLTVLCLVLLTGFITLLVQNAKLQKDNSSEKVIAEKAKENVKLEAKIIGRNVDQNGANHAITDELNKINRKTLLALAGTDSARIIDSFANLANTRLKEIHSLKQVLFTTKKELDLAVNDTGFYFKDRFLTLSINKPKPGEISTRGSYIYTGELNELSYYKKPSFFSKKVLYTNYWLSDSSATINGVRRMEVVKPLPNELNFSATAETLPSLGFYGIGAESEFRTKKINASVSYLYDVNTKKWLWGGKIKYNILGF